MSYGLAAGIWTNDIKKAHAFVASAEGGHGSGINTYGPMDAAMPFGGYKESGFGRELGAHCHRAFTELKEAFGSRCEHLSEVTILGATDSMAVSTLKDRELQANGSGCSTDWRKEIGVDHDEIRGLQLRYASFRSHRDRRHPIRPTGKGRQEVGRTCARFPRQQIRDAPH